LILLYAKHRHDIFLPNFWNSFLMSASLVTLISVFMIVISGTCISSEFSSGTVKFLLMNPVKRWKILTAKYISVLLYAAAMVVLCYIVNFLMAGFIFGFDNVGNDTANTNLWTVAQSYLWNCIPLVFMTTLVFALSALTRSSALAIGLGIFLLLMGDAITAQLYMLFKLDWLRYLPFGNLDLKSIYDGKVAFPNQTLTFAIIDLTVYMLIFFAGAWFGFVKRDIK